jgi:hypothetical protein
MRITGSARAGHFITGDELLAHHHRVLARGQRVGRVALLQRGDFGETDGGTLAHRFDDHGRTQRGERGARVGCAFHLAPGRRGQAFGDPDALGHELVHGHGRGHDAGAGVGNAHQFERTLYRAVFTEAAVQRDETTVEAFTLQVAKVAFGRIEGVGIHPFGPQCLEHAAARHQ